MPYRSLTLKILVFLILLLPLAQVKVSMGGLPLYLPELLTLAALVTYALSFQKSADFLPGRALDGWLTMGAVLFFVGALFSLLANPITLTGLGMLKTWFFFPMLMAWLFFQLELTERERSLLLRAWLFVTALVAAVALLYVYCGEVTYDGRLAAWFASPNFLAIFLAPGSLIAFSALTTRSLEKRNWKEWAFPLASFVLLLTTLFLTRSYGVWLGVVGGFLVLLLAGRQSLSKKAFLKILSAAILIAGIFFFLEYDHPKWQSLVSLEERSSLASRVMIWQSAARIIGDNSLFGIGPGRFQEAYLEYQKYFPPYLEWAVPQPHNLVLAIWLQTGLLGLIGFVMLMVRTAQILLRNKNQEAVLLLGLLTLYLIYGLFDTPYFKTDLAFAFWLILALTLTLSGSKSELARE